MKKAKSILISCLAISLALSTGCLSDSSSNAKESRGAANVAKTDQTTTIGEDESKETETNTEAETEATTVGAKEAVTEATTEAVTERTTEATTEAATEVTTEAAAEVDNGTTLVLGKTLVFDSFEFTLTGLSLTKDYKNRDVLKFTYDWVNKSKDTTMPMMSFDMVAFQDGVETEDWFSSDDIDLGLGQKNIKANGKVSAEDGVGIDDLSKPLELEFSETWTFDDTKYTMIIEDLSTLQEGIKAEAPKTDSEGSTEATTATPTVIGNTLELGKTISFDDFDFTLTGLSLTKDYKGNDVLKISYDWVNTGDEATSPFVTFNLLAFQDGVETEDAYFVDDIDLGLGQKEVKPKGKISAEDGLGIADITKPLELELSELISFDDLTYTMVIEDLSSLG